MMLPDLNEMSARVHKANAKWWQNIDTGEPIARNPKELLSLVISEISECLEGERKNLMDDKLPHRKMAEVEMADAYIRLLDFAGGFGQPLNGTIVYCSPESISENKGEALFTLSKIITMIGDEFPYSGSRICSALKFIESYCTKHGYDLFGAIEAKLIFNSTRIDHTHEARRIAGGKQF